MRYDLLHVVPWYYMQEYRNDDIASYRWVSISSLYEIQAGKGQSIPASLSSGSTAGPRGHPIPGSLSSGPTTDSFGP